MFGATCEHRDGNHRAVLLEDLRHADLAPINPISCRFPVARCGALTHACSALASALLGAALADAALGDGLYVITS